jgi:hypothetical protein
MAGRRIRVISGGQTGVDQAAWRAAKAVGFWTGGWMPKGYQTEDGPRPEFAEWYGAKACDSSDYTVRTRLNVEDSDRTLWLGATTSPGFAATERWCTYYKKRIFIVEPGTKPSDVASWVLLWNGVSVLNVGGSRESRNAGVGERAERFLVAVFRRLIRGQ